MMMMIVYYIQIWNKKHNIITSRVISSHMGPVYIETPYNKLDLNWNIKYGALSCETNNLQQNASPKSRYRTSLRQERKWWKRINPTGIDQQNNHYRFKELLKDYNKLDATFRKHTREAKEKYPKY